MCVENCKNVTNTFQLAARIEIYRNCVTENRIKNWLDKSQKANLLITLVSLLFISWQEITDFEKLNPFITNEYPFMIHQSVWNYAPYSICCYFYEFFCLCSLQLVYFTENCNFSVYGVYIWKSFPYIYSIHWKVAFFSKR